MTFTTLVRLNGRDADQERAAMARLGGNLYRRRINATIRTQPGLWATDRSKRQDDLILQELASLMNNQSHLVGSYWQGDPSPDDPARFWGFTYVMSPRSFDVLLPEAAFDWPIYRAAVVPQVVINISADNGGTEVIFTRGKADVIDVDWDAFTAPGNYEVEDLRAARKRIERIVEPGLRDRCLADMDELIAQLDSQDPIIEAGEANRPCSVPGCPETHGHSIRHLPGFAGDPR